MNNEKEISLAGLKKLTELEALRLVAYRCSAKKLTIGYGTTVINGVPVKEGQTCTEEQAWEYLKKDIVMFSHLVKLSFHSVELTQFQFDALVMFAYNNGGFAKAPTLVKTILADPHNKPAIKDAFNLYVKALADSDGIDNDGDGVVDEPGERKTVKGLINRANMQFEWFFKIK